MICGRLSLRIAASSCSAYALELFNDIAIKEPPVSFGLFQTCINTFEELTSFLYVTGESKCVVAVFFQIDSNFDWNNNHFRRSD
jgi:hypothetical protein